MTDERADLELEAEATKLAVEILDLTLAFLAESRGKKFDDDAWRAKILAKMFARLNAGKLLS